MRIYQQHQRIKIRKREKYKQKLQNLMIYRPIYVNDTIKLFMKCQKKRETPDWPRLKALHIPWVFTVPSFYLIAIQDQR